MTPDAPARSTLFISDLHLSPERPDALSRFTSFLRETAIHAEALYILGDFFELWVGDDDLHQPLHQHAIAELRRLTEAGVGVRFLPGNRDFLIGPAFAAAAGLQLLPDPSVIRLYGVPTLITHGDQMCTDDAAYQTYRTQVHDPDWQREFLAQPLIERIAFALHVRDQSEQAKAGKRPEIMDVNPAAVAQWLARYGVARIIHGHTHRPARHVHPAGERECERWVLPDWYEGGGHLCCDQTGCRLRLSADA
ncbi:MAG: UDP-2,3-diacylglucosamine diphosphatase [Betaproteobacteria bacterium]|nr:UDP-2,3-diacylglucosamine diphosphatase [Betaproteobacteria bacterium]